MNSYITVENNKDKSSAIVFVDHITAIQTAQNGNVFICLTGGDKIPTSASADSVLAALLKPLAVS